MQYLTGSPFTRRAFLGRTATGIGAAALAQAFYGFAPPACAACPNAPPRPAPRRVLRELAVESHDGAYVLQRCREPQLVDERGSALGAFE